MRRPWAILTIAAAAGLFLGPGRSLAQAWRLDRAEGQAIRWYTRNVGPIRGEPRIEWLNAKELEDRHREAGGRSWDSLSGLYLPAEDLILLDHDAKLPSAALLAHELTHREQYFGHPAPLFLLSEAETCEYFSREVIAMEVGRRCAADLGLDGAGMSFVRGDAITAHQYLLASVDEHLLGTSFDYKELLDYALPPSREWFSRDPELPAPSSLPQTDFRSEFLATVSDRWRGTPVSPFERLGPGRFFWEWADHQTLEQDESKIGHETRIYDFQHPDPGLLAADSTWFGAWDDDRLLVFEPDPRQRLTLVLVQFATQPVRDSFFAWASLLWSDDSPIASIGDRHVAWTRQDAIQTRREITPNGAQGRYFEIDGPSKIPPGEVASLFTSWTTYWSQALAPPR